jgi:uncharacterized protein (DUF305 family)
MAHQPIPKKNRDSAGLPLASVLTATEQRCSRRRGTSVPRVVVVFVIAACVASCRTTAPASPPIVQPGAPGEAAHVVAGATAADLSHVQFVGDDVRFMQGMIGHHAQAVAMVALARTHSNRDDIHKLALRIDLSQQDEIGMMRHWLDVRGQPSEGMHQHGALMPGMLTPDQMLQLANAEGDEFDRLFLAGMIKHHSGALAMVAALFSMPRAGQEVEIFSFASDVDADQRMEIDRMSAMLAAVVKEHQQ